MHPDDYAGQSRAFRAFGVDRAQMARALETSASVLLEIGFSREAAHFCSSGSAMMPEPRWP
ncbi:hypothetical protein [Streptacidiphilus rugosus]|uniref:hypothetical protein n=1 Tax=Streptacidiphilus rugosus TaxID=405783 RepID=UPI0012F7DEF0|nr:hypothetical protein [Streptacidiphilus rugosus]